MNFSVVVRDFKIQDGEVVPTRYVHQFHTRKRATEFFLTHEAKHLELFKWSYFRWKWIRLSHINRNTKNSKGDTKRESQSRKEH